MAKELYIPVNGFSKKTSKFYAPVNGFSKEIVKAYCSVNGFSKLFYVKGGGQRKSGIWFFYSTVAETVVEGKCDDIPNPIWVDVDKLDLGFAFYFIMPSQVDPYYDPWHWVVTLSPDSTAIPYMYDGWDGNKRTSQQYTITYNGETWYLGVATPLSFVTKPIYPTDYTPDCLYEYQFNAGQAVLDYMMPLQIYSNNFAEDYQVGGYYDIVLGDIETTIRKAIGVFLFKNYTLKGNTDYDTLLENIDTIINGILSRCEQGNYDKICIKVSTGTHASEAAKWIRISADLSNLDILNPSTLQPTSTINITARRTANGYDSMDMRNNVRCNYNISYYINNNGLSIQHDGAVAPYQLWSNLGLNVYTQNNYLQVYMSNIGLNL